jgi:hypothetical protein
MVFNTTSQPTNLIPIKVEVIDSYCKKNSIFSNGEHNAVLKEQNKRFIPAKFGII